VVGVIAAFLPFASVSVQMQGPGGADPFGMFGGRGGGQPAMSVNKTAMVIENWRGAVGLVGYVAAVVLAFVLYPRQGLTRKALSWAAVAAGLLVAVLAVWLLVLALDTGSADLMGMGSVKSSVGFGAFINVVAAVAVAAGGLLKAREEKLI
jgi:hypothetical protein